LKFIVVVVIPQTKTIDNVARTRAAALLADYWQKTVDRTVEKWRFAEVDLSSAYNDFGGFFNVPNYPNTGAFAVPRLD
jgi:hypothetical protein